MLAPLALVSLGVLTHHASAWFISPPTDLTTKMGHAGVNVRYKQVPAGICEQDPRVKTFSGYADVEENQHYFFVFVEARNQDPTNAPLTVWLNGGPGASSLMGMFSEMGPCGIDPNGKPFNNPYSWTNVSNVLFIDQPAGAGYSYTVPMNGYYDYYSSNFMSLPNTDGCPDYADDSCGTISTPSAAMLINSTAAMAPLFWKTLQGFMGAFPQYARGSFHLAAESYGGKYGPVYSAYLQQQNAAKIPDTVPIEQKSLILVNPMIDEIKQTLAYYDFFVNPGNTYDLKPFNATITAQIYNWLHGPGNCLDLYRDCETSGSDSVCWYADDICSNVLDIVSEVTFRDMYDLREMSPGVFPYSFYGDYLNSPDVLKALGAATNWTGLSYPIFNSFYQSGNAIRPIPYKTQLTSLLDAGIAVAVVAGDADVNCNWLGAQAVINDMDLPGWSASGFVDVTSSDGVVHAQSRQAGRFSFTRAFYSGHQVPFYQPLLMLELLDRVIGGHDVATGRDTPTNTDYVTKGPATSSFREGMATVQMSPVSPNATYNYTTHGPGQPWKLGPPSVRKTGGWQRNTPGRWGRN